MSHARMNHAMGIITAGSLLALVGPGTIAPLARANDNPVMLQWFETKWTDIEHRAPDYFVAGYGSLWLPPISRAYVWPGSTNQNGDSAGYDVFDRFDLGKPNAQTAYGTEQYFRAMMDELHAANAQVYIDAILNHNSGRQTGVGFMEDGGYPGFWMQPPTPMRNKTATDPWGDFHAGTAAGYLQSEDPNGPRYNLYDGDLVALIDINQFSNNLFVRNPVAAGATGNIPGGRYFNNPNPDNARFYPDRNLPPVSFTNPAIRGKPAENVQVYPFNTSTPLAGDPTLENASGYLQRWVQWTLDELKVDGFRLDAMKHVPPLWWDQAFDTAVYNRRRLPDGRMVTPFSFGEIVDSGSTAWNNFARKDGFGNRDALDISGSGELRNLVNAGGTGNWLNVLGAHFDNADDGDNNGSFGINHVFSHDNGSAGNGGSAPPNPTDRQMGMYTYAYVLLRTGLAEVYHNGRGIARSGGFWPRQGMMNALGFNPNTSSADPTITNLVQLHNFYARGAWNVINGPDFADLIIFERRAPGGVSHALVGVNDRYDAGWDQRFVATNFPAGTRLVEMTGNAANPIVDPLNEIPEVLTVNAGQTVTIRVPRNRMMTTDHHKGFVVYGLPIANGTLTIGGTSGTIAPDSAAIPFSRRRLTSVPVVTGNTFTINLTTTNGDPGGVDQNSDDNSVFRIDQGFQDWNGNGVVDIDGTNSIVPGYEQFVTLRQPLFGSGQSTGNYSQTIDATRLSEGYHYISVISFRKRNAGEPPVFREFRTVVYVDRQCPQLSLATAQPITTTTTSIAIKALDRTVPRMYMVRNPAPGVDPVTLATIGNAAQRSDRYDWSRTLSGFVHGVNRVGVITQEDSGRTCMQVFEVFAQLCVSDMDDGSGSGTPDGGTTIDDLLYYLAIFEAGDIRADVDDGSGTGVRDGGVTIDDLLYYLVRFENGC